MTCKDCVHYEVCGFTSITSKSVEKDCRDFKNKADFVEVVHCKDCKYSVNGRCQNVDNRFAQIKPDDYCSYGERRCK